MREPRRKIGHEGRRYTDRGGEILPFRGQIDGDTAVPKREGAFIGCGDDGSMQRRREHEICGGDRVDKGFDVAVACANIRPQDQIRPAPGEQKIVRAPIMEMRNAD